jgi:hypothetical protein
MLMFSAFHLFPWRLAGSVWLFWLLYVGAIFGVVGCAQDPSGLVGLGGFYPSRVGFPDWSNPREEGEAFHLSRHRAWGLL